MAYHLWNSNYQPPSLWWVIPKAAQRPYGLFSTAVEWYHNIIAAVTMKTNTHHVSPNLPWPSASLWTCVRTNPCWRDAVITMSMPRWTENDGPRNCTTESLNYHWKMELPNWLTIKSCDRLAKKWDTFFHNTFCSINFIATIPMRPSFYHSATQPNGSIPLWTGFICEDA